MAQPPPFTLLTTDIPPADIYGVVHDARERRGKWRKAKLDGKWRGLNKLRKIGKRSYFIFAARCRNDDRPVCIIAVSKKGGGTCGEERRAIIPFLHNRGEEEGGLQGRPIAAKI